MHAKCAPIIHCVWTNSIARPLVNINLFNVFDITLFDMALCIGVQWTGVGVPLFGGCEWDCVLCTHIDVSSTHVDEISLILRNVVDQDEGNHLM